MNNKRRLFSTVLCVAALTAGLFVSGCGSDKAGGIGSVVSSVVDGGDEKAAAKLNTLIDATNRFNSDNASFAQFQAEGLAKLKGGFAEGAITNQPHYDRLQADLEKAKKEGSTFKEVDAERDNVLNILNELVPVYKDLTAYDDSKAYMNDGGAKGKELAAKFDAAYAKFNETLNKVNAEQSKKQIEKLKKDGKKGYAAAMESTLRLTTLVDNLEKAPQKADKAAVEKELSEIEALLKSINNDRGQVLADRYNSVVGDVRQVLADPSDNNLNNMIEGFNGYIDTYNSTTPDQFDAK